MKMWDDLDDTWYQALKHTRYTQPMQQLADFLQQETVAGHKIYPAEELYCAALNATPLDKVKVVILGQDPYHGAGQAHGLSFSVASDMPIPASLRNIYKELQQDLGVESPAHGCLISWAEQGVLLLNSVLSVRQGEAASHRKQGWEQWTDEVIHTINREKSHVVFILWGKDAQQKGSAIDASKHLILKAAHPSPLSAYRGFFAGAYFSKSNAYLEKHGITPIQWAIPDLQSQYVLLL
ncbi:MAG: uracil-DNA glycosylase [Mariprofundaceae bacterium]|nr:uracil-DNA glycosylase [Mariprofundaceae bacterium]